MAYDTQAYENHHGDPVVVMVVTGEHDVSRLVNLLSGGLCEHMPIRDHIVRQLHRRARGRDALKLLKAHGGPDLLEPSMLTGREADQLAVGSVVRWKGDRSEGGQRTKTGDEWKPALDTSERRQYVLLHDAGGAS